MSTDADHMATKKAAGDKRIADEANASAAATTDWPTGGYNTFTSLLFIFMCAVLVVCVDVSTICLVRAYIIKIQYVISTAYVMFMIYYWAKLIKQLLNFSTIQKPNVCRSFSNSGFAAALKPSPFTGTYFKRWQTKTVLWLTAMNVFWVTGVSTGTIAPEQEKAFREATTVFL